jgi:hypothetical protein
MAFRVSAAITLDEDQSGGIPLSAHHRHWILSRDCLGRVSGSPRLSHCRHTLDISGDTETYFLVVNESTSGTELLKRVRPLVWCDMSWVPLSE